MSVIICPRCKRRSLEVRYNNTEHCLYIECGYKREPLTEVEKTYEAKPYSQKIGEFMDWLVETKQVQLAQYHHHDTVCENQAMKDTPYPFNPRCDGYYICGYSEGDLQPFRYTMDKLLMEFFGIDERKLEEEKLKIIESLEKGEL